MNFLETYYNSYDEEGRLLSRHGQVEYRTTMKYVRECLAGIAAPSVLEVGAGTGRYSVTLAKQGLRVTAVELIPHNLELLKAKLDGSEQLSALQGNALDLSMLREAEYPLAPEGLAGEPGLPDGAVLRGGVFSDRICGALACLHREGKL